jgi:bacillolysin
MLTCWDRTEWGQTRGQNRGQTPVADGLTGVRPLLLTDSHLGDPGPGRLQARSIAAAILAAACLLATTRAQSPVRARAVSLTATAGDPRALRQVDDAIVTMLREGRLRRASRTFDSLVDGAEHQQLQQVHRGVPVWGSTIAMQLKAAAPVSTFGGVFEGLDQIDIVPTLSPEAARGIAAEAAGVELGPLLPMSLVIHVADDGAVRLAYTVRATTRAVLTHRYFIDAHTGAIIEARLDTRTQVAVGLGTGVIEDTKKVSALQLGGAFVLTDRQRPQETQTYDLAGNLGAVLAVLNGTRALGTGDLGTDFDNSWEDPALVDAHVYSGWTFDYLYKRFNRTSVYEHTRPIINIVHPLRREDYVALGAFFPQFFANAGYFGSGIQIYGDGLPRGTVIENTGQEFTYMAGAIDIVAHEIAHAFTEHLECRDESGALTETLSDVIGTSVEFFFQRQGGGRGVRDYQIGEDVVSFGAIRSMSDPTSVANHPNLYQNRRRLPDDNGSVHANAGIGNQAFYLAIEGGPHPTTGYLVPGVGPQNREQIERIFYRGISQMLPARATFSLARAATIQAARDLYGTSSAAVTAITEAWTAVGVQ